MAQDILSTNPTEILEQFQTAYVDQMGQRMRIGSEEYTLSAIYSYVLAHYAELVNKSYANQNLDTASGEFLDNIASKYGLNRTRPTYSNPWFEAHIKVNPECAYYGAHSRSFTYQIFKGGAWYKALQNEAHPQVELSEDYVRWIAIEPGDEYATKQEVLDSFLKKTAPKRNDPNTMVPMFAGMTINDVTDVQGNFNVAKSGNLSFAPMTDDDAFREYIKANKDLYRPGIAGAFEATAKNSSDYIADAHVLVQGEYNFQPGLVRVYCKPREFLTPNGQIPAYYSMAVMYDVPAVYEAIEKQNITTIGQTVVIGTDEGSANPAAATVVPARNTPVPLTYTFYVPKAYRGILFDPDPSVVDDRVTYEVLYRLKFAAVIAYLNKNVLNLGTPFLDMMPFTYMQLPLSTIAKTPEDLDILPPDGYQVSNTNAYTLFDYYKDLPVLGLHSISGNGSINGFLDGKVPCYPQNYIRLNGYGLYSANNDGPIRCNLEYI